MKTFVKINLIVFLNTILPITGFCTLGNPHIYKEDTSNFYSDLNIPVRWWESQEFIKKNMNFDLGQILPMGELQQTTTGNLMGDSLNYLLKNPNEFSDDHQIQVQIFKLSRFLAAYPASDFIINKYSKKYICPFYSIIYRNRGVLKYKLYDFNGSNQDLTKAISFDSTNADGWFQRGKANYVLKNNEYAKRDWSRAGELGMPISFDYLQRFYCPNVIQIVRDFLINLVSSRSDLVYMQEYLKSEEWFWANFFLILLTLFICLFPISIIVIILHYVVNWYIGVNKLDFKDSLKYKNEQWEVGQKVQFKEGGPVMAIEKIKIKWSKGENYSRNEIICIWFDNDYKMHRETLEIGFLKKIKHVYDAQKYPK